MTRGQLARLLLGVQMYPLARMVPYCSGICAVNSSTGGITHYEPFEWCNAGGIVNRIALTTELEKHNGPPNS